MDIHHLGARIVKEAHGEASFFVRLERSTSTKETLDILKDVIDSCRGPQYDHFRRLLRNFVLCCLDRGSWADDLDKPMPMEEFEEMYDNYPKWARMMRNPWDEGMKEGMKKGEKKGIKEGILEGKATLLSLLVASLTAKIRERFGDIPSSWATVLSDLKDPQQIIDLTGAAYTAQTSEEFEAILLKLA